jgi:hypothetical protein
MEYAGISDEELVQALEMFDELELIFGVSVISEEFKLDLFHEISRREELMQAEVEE